MGLFNASTAASGPILVDTFMLLTALIYNQLIALELDERRTEFSVSDLTN